MLKFAAKILAMFVFWFVFTLLVIGYVCGSFDYSAWAAGDRFMHVLLALGATAVTTGAVIGGIA